MRTVSGNACNMDTAPTLLNANNPTPDATGNANTSFTCNFGYESSIAPEKPYYTCDASTGLWTAVTGTCNGKLYMYSIHSRVQPVL